ncbi:MAG: EcsC family protein [Verrucomicrobiota bacterium]|nr:EcsC family protein [Verrucomicrobiota bacterium]
MAGFDIGMQIEFESIPAILSENELKDLRRARLMLEQSSLASRLTKAVGGPIDELFSRMPLGLSGMIHRAAGTALSKAAHVATWTMHNHRGKPASNGFHQCALMLSGGLGGSLGLATLTWELPFSTVLMLRSIADIARSEGHSLRDASTRMACLEVFAYEGGGKAEERSEKHYWAVRMALAKAVSEAAAYAASAKTVNQSLPALSRLVSAIASRFGVMVSEHFAAKSIPLLGALGGMGINLIFVQHFQNIARAHFIIRRLEKKHGNATIQELYQSVALPFNPR